MDIQGHTHLSIYNLGGDIKHLNPYRSVIIYITLRHLLRSIIATNNNWKAETITDPKLYHQFTKSKPKIEYQKKLSSNTNKKHYAIPTCI